MLEAANDNEVAHRDHPKIARSTQQEIETEVEMVEIRDQLHSAAR
jgi:hypothetical protein